MKKKQGKTRASNSSKNEEKMILVSVFYDLFLSACTTTTMITINATQSVPRISVFFLSLFFFLRKCRLLSHPLISISDSHPPLSLGTVCFVFSSIA